MKTILAIGILAWLFVTQAQAQNYTNNRAPLKEKTFIELPLGSIKPKGWLHEMLVRQKNGASGQLDQLYPQVMGPRNGWLGGDGDQWERGPYWIDGLLPLAYILDDQELKDKVQPWVEWAIKSQRPDGYFGPSTDYGPEKGLQRNNSQDWWPKMVMLKVLQQYYSATGDQRVIKLMSNYFKYQLKTLPEKPLGNWTFWAEYRSADNLQAVYWLYNITGEKHLLELGNILHEQGYDFVDMFLNRDDLTRINTIHCVNLAQGIKEPVIYYQQDSDEKYLHAVKKAFADIRQFHGQPQGMYGGDEALHGNNPTQGSELCSAVELMFSLEKMMEITGDLQFADHLERVAFNALPTQVSDDFMTRQYFQQVNQVKISRHPRNFDINHGETDLVYGLRTGYPCCTSNMHQGWPKFTQNLWYATKDNGLAALVFSPSEVRAKVGDGVAVKMTEDTNYPFNEGINFKLDIEGKQKKVAFPFHVRIPSWSKNAKVTINGKPWEGEAKPNSIIVINRTWKSGDVVALDLPMHIETSTWYENAMAVERGPLVYALKVEEDWSKKQIKDNPERYGREYYEVSPATDWNYGILDFPKDKTQEVFTVVKKDTKGAYPWNLAGAPIEIKVKGKQLPFWSLYNEMAGPQPYSRMIYGISSVKEMPEVELTLIPYGCTTLRVTEFPVIKEYE
ncbi:beta-L-arabinofuranosidase domain-containing protein [Pontibacter mangrovi]|uniref:DUF1680 family protein n=1 Tax=Pontibacter mangrovi TaxID=2589816 RepID=A0A501WB60_9BACT|nr:beta-L-arabinofuranosidase domain-containing protein [Pontibacter mangrovi]TPE44047.1 hypothetical protein FJM65_11545 [Pontibacter mangrovi]